MRCHTGPHRVSPELGPQAQGVREDSTGQDLPSPGEGGGQAEPAQDRRVVWITSAGSGVVPSWKGRQVMRPGIVSLPAGAA